jgi:effector-binding domain-containing protein
MKCIDTQPVLKEIRPINFLYFRAEARVDQLLNFVPVAKDLFKEAVDYNLHVTGPIHWHYFGFSSNPLESFTLEISLPVSDVVAGYDGNFHFKRTEPFPCVALTHEGGWDRLSGSYSKIMEFMESEHLETSGMTREVYVNTDFNNPDGNITEIQIGLKQ